MKKILSIILVFSLPIPAYAVVKPAKQDKKQDSPSSKPMQRARAVLDRHSQCLATGKGKKCSKDKFLALQVIRNFVKGNKKEAKAGLRAFLRRNWECWRPVLEVMAVLGVAGGAAGLGALLGSMGEGVADVMSAAGTLGVMAGGAATVALVSVHKKMEKQEQPKRTFGQKLKKLLKCMLIIGVELAIVLAIVFVIRALAAKAAKERAQTSEQIDSPAYLEEKFHEARAANKSLDTVIIPENGYTFLIQAIRKKMIDLINTLIDEGADLNKADKNGDTPLHWAIKTKNKEVAQLLLDKKANPNKTNNKMETPLKLAVQNNLKELVILLLEKKANPDTSRPLHLAVKNKNEEIALLLLENKANPNERDASQMTPLMIAAAIGRDPMIHLLLKHGADKEMENSAHLQAWEIAQEAFGKYIWLPDDRQKLMDALKPR